MKPKISVCIPVYNVEKYIRNCIRSVQEQNFQDFEIIVVNDASPDGSMDLTTNVQTITKIMIPYGLKQNNTFQDFPDLITFYPKDYFCPKSYKDGKIYLTNNTVTIHHFAGSWVPKIDKIKKISQRLLGAKLTSLIVRIKRLFK